MTQNHGSVMKVLTFVVATSVVAAFVAASGPALRAQSPTSTSQKLSTEWKRLRAAGMEVIGNASDKELRRTLDQVGSFRAVLKALLPGIQFTSSEPTVLIVFRDYRSFQRFVPRDGRGRKLEGVGGYFEANPVANVLVLPLSGSSQLPFQTAFHEYIHYLVYRNLQHVPLWLNEGLADFYSTFEINDKGKGIIGRAPPARIHTLRGRPLPPLGRLLSGESALRLFSDADTPMFYSHAWLFVHYVALSDGGKRQSQIWKYLQLVQSSISYQAAVQQAFGVSLEALDGELREYGNRFLLPALVVTGSLTRADSDPDPVERLTEADAAYIQGQLLTNVGAAEDAEAFLVKALALDPTHTRARIALGRVRVLQQRYDEAIAVLSGVVQDASDDFVGHYYLASALGSAGRREESLKEFERGVSLNQQSASAWFGLSSAAMTLGRDIQSETAMRQVERLDAGPRWHYVRARFALTVGRNEAAVRAAGRYFELAGWADESAPYAAFIGAIAHWRLGQKVEADALLAQTAAATSPKS